MRERRRGIPEAVAIGMLVMLAGSIPRNILFLANLRILPSVPWAVPVVGLYMWAFWQYLNGKGPPESTSDLRRASLRAGPVPGRAWVWSLLAGGLALVALVLGLRLANRLVVLPAQQLPDLGAVPQHTVVALLVMSAPVAGIVEEAAFRGYMQGPIERRYGIGVAILITGTMFAVAHLDFTLILWPYYISVAALYGVVTYLTGSIRPAVVLHTAGNTYSNFDLWMRGRAEWQAASGSGSLVWSTGPDAAFVTTGLAVVLCTVAAVWAYVQLSHVSGPRDSPAAGSE